MPAYKTEPEPWEEFQAQAEAESQGEPREYKKLCGTKDSDALEELRRQRYAERCRRSLQSALWLLRANRATYGLPENPKKAGADEDEELAKLLWPAEASCGSVNCGSVSMAFRKGEEGRSRPANLRRCHKVWTCPHCSKIIRKKRAEEIAEAVRRHMKNGGGFVLLTETLQHKIGDALAKLIKCLTEAHRELTSTGAYKSMKKKFGLVGYVKALEITIGENGWHPHFHFLLFLERPVGPAEVKAMKDEVYKAWAKCIEKQGGYSSEDHGLDFTSMACGRAAGLYISKIAEEVTNASGAKEGRGSLTPFQLLDSHTRKNELLWREYAAATKGKSCIRWSRGLRKTLGMEAAKSDAELVEEENRRGEETAFVTRDVWAKVRTDAEAQETMAAMIDEGRDEELAARLGCELSYRLMFDSEGWPRFVPVFGREEGQEIRWTVGGDGE